MLQVRDRQAVAAGPRILVTRSLARVPRLLRKTHGGTLVRIRRRRPRLRSPVSLARFAQGANGLQPHRQIPASARRGGRRGRCVTFQRPGRSPVHGTRGVAATSHPLASATAIDDAARGRQRRRCGGGCVRRAGRGRAAVHRHRRRLLRALCAGRPGAALRHQRLRASAGCGERRVVPGAGHRRHRLRERRMRSPCRARSAPGRGCWPTTGPRASTRCSSPPSTTPKRASSSTAASPTTGRARRRSCGRARTRAPSTCRAGVRPGPATSTACRRWPRRSG